MILIARITVRYVKAPKTTFAPKIFPKYFPAISRFFAVSRIKTDESPRSTKMEKIVVKETTKKYLPVPSTPAKRAIKIKYKKGKPVQKYFILTAWNKKN